MLDVVDYMSFVSYSQSFEDVILWRALKHIEKGFYVDVGANDPEIDSVTHAFYQRGWHGINIEPAQEYYDKLCRDRVHDVNLLTAVGATTGEAIFYHIKETGLSTLNSEVAKFQKSSNNFIVEEAPIHLETLNNIFDKHCFGPIHFLKVDVEGFEEEVLQGLDLNVWRPWIILIEANYPSTQAANFVSWEPYILQSGYQFVYFDGLNRFYVANEMSDLVPAFSAPPNIFDGFIKSSEREKIVQIEELNAVIQEHEKLIEEVNFDRQQIESLNKELGRALTANHEQTKIIASENKKSADMLTELNRALTENFEQSKTIASDKKKNSDLQSELNELRKKLEVSFAELTHAQEQINGANQELAIARTQVIELRTELEKVYRSRSYRITAPFRVIFGLGRVVRDRFRKPKGRKSYSLMQRFEPVAYSWIVKFRRNNAYVQFKNGLKKRFPNLWNSVRSVFLPSYVKTDTFYISNVKLDVKDSHIVLMSTDEQHYFDLFQREIKNLEEPSGETL